MVRATSRPVDRALEAARLSPTTGSKLAIDVVSSKTDRDIACRYRRIPKAVTCRPGAPLRRAPIRAAGLAALIAAALAAPAAVEARRPVSRAARRAATSPAASLEICREGSEAEGVLISPAPCAFVRGVQILRLARAEAPGPAAGAVPGADPGGDPPWRRALSGAARHGQPRRRRPAHRPHLRGPGHDAPAIGRPVLGRAAGRSARGPAAGPSRRPPPRGSARATRSQSPAATGPARPTATCSCSGRSAWASPAARMPIPGRGNRRRRRGPGPDAPADGPADVRRRVQIEARTLDFQTFEIRTRTADGYGLAWTPFEAGAGRGPERAADAGRGARRGRQAGGLRLHGAGLRDPRPRRVDQHRRSHLPLRLHGRAARGLRPRPRETPHRALPAHGAGPVRPEGLVRGAQARRAAAARNPRPRGAGQGHAALGGVLHLPKAGQRARRPGGRYLPAIHAPT